MVSPPEKERASTEEASIIGIDLAKRAFQLHGAAADGSVVFRKKLSRAQLFAFPARRPACTVAMELVEGEAQKRVVQWAGHLTNYRRLGFL